MSAVFPRRLVKRTRNAWFRLAGVPLSTNCVEFEECFHSLGDELAAEDALIARILDEISDDEVVHQKGEGPETVLEVGGCQVPRKGAVLMHKYFIARRVHLIRRALPEVEAKRLIDVGATSDLIFRYLGQRGLGVNISPPAVEYMRAREIEAELGDAEALAYPDDSFDVALCFQTIEHLENPLRGLRELARVARERIFISIPHSPTTRVCPWEPAGKGRHRWHFIEFSPADFEKVIRRAGLRVRSREIIRSWRAPRSWSERQFVRRYAGHSWLRGFAFYELERKA